MFSYGRSQPVKSYAKGKSDFGENFSFWLAASTTKCEDGVLGPNHSVLDPVPVKIGNGIQVGRGGFRLPPEWYFRENEWQVEQDEACLIGFSNSGLSYATVFSVYLLSPACIPPAAYNIGNSVEPGLYATLPEIGGGSLH